MKLQMNHKICTKTLSHNVLSLPMQKDLSYLFNKTAPTIPDTLSQDIFTAIEYAARAHARERRYIWGTFSVLSIGGCITSGVYAAHAATTSGFSSYFSIIFSDSGTAIKLWREIGLSLLESLPLIGTLVILASIAAVLWSLRNFSKQFGGHLITTNVSIA